MDRRKVFAERLTSARKTKLWTKQHLATRVGVSDVAIGYYEHATTWPGVEALIALAEALDVSLDWLCGLSDEPKRVDAHKKP